jgi:hypothetical protein
MAFTLVELLAALMFVASSGIFFQERFRRNRFLVVCAGTIALVSTYLLTEELVDRAISQRLASFAQGSFEPASASGDAPSEALTETTDVPHMRSPPPAINATEPDMSATADNSESQRNTLDATSSSEHSIGIPVANLPPGVVIGRVEQVRARERYLIVQQTGDRSLTVGSSVWISTEVGTIVRGNVERVSNGRFSVTVGSEFELVKQGDSVRILDL